MSEEPYYGPPREEDKVPKGLIDLLFEEQASLRKRVGELENRIEDWRANFWSLFAGGVALFIIICIVLSKIS